MTGAMSNGKPQVRNDELRSAAFHEAGHAVVARFYGLAVGEIVIGIGDSEAAGRTQIALDDHLPLIDRIALCMAGIAAQELFGSPSREWLGMDDCVKIGELVEGLGHSASLEIRVVGLQRACEILRRHRSGVRRLAGRLIDQRRIVIADDLPRRGGGSRRSRTDMAMMANPAHKKRRGRRRD